MDRQEDQQTRGRLERGLQLGDLDQGTVVGQADIDGQLLGVVGPPLRERGRPSNAGPHHALHAHDGLGVEVVARERLVHGDDLEHRVVAVLAPKADALVAGVVRWLRDIEDVRSPGTLVGARKLEEDAKEATRIPRDQLDLERVYRPHGHDVSIGPELFKPFEDGEHGFDNRRVGDLVGDERVRIQSIGHPEPGCG